MWSLPCLIAQGWADCRTCTITRSLRSAAPKTNSTGSLGHFTFSTVLLVSVELFLVKIPGPKWTPAKLMLLSMYLHYTLKTMTLALPGTLNMFLVLSLSLLPTVVFNVAKSIITSPHHCFSW